MNKRLILTIVIVLIAIFAFLLLQPKIKTNTNPQSTTTPVESNVNTPTPVTSEKPYIKIISPAGGEKFKSNSPITVTWTQNYNSNTVRICLMTEHAGCTFSSPVMNGSIGQNTWTIPASAKKVIYSENPSKAYLDTSYRISVQTDNPPKSGLAGEFFGIQSNNFNITE